MFDIVRRHQRLIQILIGLMVIPSLVVVGAWDLISPSSDANTVARVGKHKIQMPQWERAHQQTLDQIRVQLGGKIDASLFDSSGARLSTLNDLVTQQVLLDTAVNARIRITDDQMRLAIASIPSVQKNGQFDMALYQQALKAQGLTPEAFEARVRADMLAEVLPTALGASAIAPRSVARRLAQAAHEYRTIRVRKFSIAEQLSGMTVSDVEVQEFYQANAAQFQTPEEIDIQLIAFSKPESADRVEQFSNLVYEQSDTLEPAAKKLGLTIQTIKGVRRQGGAANLSPETTRVLTHPKMIAAMFGADTLLNKRNTEAVEVAPGILASARVIAHHLAAPVPLANVKPLIEKQLRERKAIDKATQLAETSAKSFTANTTNAAQGLSSPRTVLRSESSKAAGDLPPDVLGAVFAAEIKSVPTNPVAISVPANSKTGAAWMVVIDSAGVPAADAPVVKDSLGHDFQRLEQSSARDLLDRWVGHQRSVIGVQVWPEKLTKSDSR